MPFKKVDTRQKYSEMEKDVLKFWKESKVFEKSVEQRSKDNYYSFYDGPPFITGVPHYGTLLSSIVKDCVPRFWTMKGKRVERRWGWDCHGLPAENMVEKKLGIKSKKEIEEEIGIKKFNKACFQETSQIASEWEEIIDRIGRWVEFKNAYKTMDKDFMESVWWAFKQLHEKGLVYEDVRVSLYCPRCATPLSNFEIAMDNSYEMDKDPSVYVKIKVKREENTYFLVWTTTPWTLPANVALTVGENIKYEILNISETGEKYIVAKDRVEEVLKDLEFEVEKEISGKELVGMRYEPIFPHDIKNGYKVISGDFVTTEDGTGIVHIAPAFGEDDFNARKEHGLPIILNVDQEGKFIEGDWKGMNVWEANFKVLGWLKEHGFMFKKENITHSYPHCHRCHTKLIYKAQDAWFVAVDKIREKLLKKNENINWIPDFLKHGRFQKGIESAPDWNISRDRYWGTGIPVWKCSNKKCEDMKVIGSYEELEKLSGKKLDDYHRPGVDEIVFKCEKCGGEMKRVPQVFDSWIESGSMPFAQFHYPFENKEKFEKSFPSDFISEYIAQTRAWFYVLHVVSVGIFDKESFKNVVTTGTIAGEDGRKMSKSLGNYTDPGIVLEKYSADALRFFLLSSPLMHAQNINFSEATVRDIQRKLLGTLWNSYSFFVLYANVDKWKPAENATNYKLQTTNLLDKWIVSELNQLIKTVDENMQKYDLVRAAKPIEKFVDDLSNWYIRRSRRRFWKSESDEDKNAAYQTLWHVLVEFSKVIAPFCPFVADEIYKNLTDELKDTKESVHLCDFPAADEKMIDEALSNQMAQTRDVINRGLAIRASKGLKVRQPLSELLVKENIKDDFKDIIKEELNIKDIKKVDEVTESDIIAVSKDVTVYPPTMNLNKKEQDVTKSESENKIGLNIEITPELKLEGQMRELVRHIQQARKEAGFEVDDRIKVWYDSGSEIFEKYKAEIAKEVLANDINPAEKEDLTADYSKDIKIDGQKIKIWLKKD